MTRRQVLAGAAVCVPPDLERARTCAKCLGKVTGAGFNVAELHLAGGRVIRLEWCAKCRTRTFDEVLERIRASYGSAPKW